MTDPVNVSDGQTPPDEPDAPQGGIVVGRNFDAEGKVSVEVRLFGDAKVTEGETILGLALRTWRADAGL